MVRKRARIRSHERKHERAVSPEREGIESVSGTNPSPESDDNVLDNAHKVGLYEGDKEQELGLGEEINKGEEYEKTH